MFSLHAGFRAGRLLPWLESHPAFDAGREQLAQVLSGTGVTPSRGAFENTEIWLPTAGKARVPSSALIAEIRTTKNIRIARSTIDTLALETPAALDLLCYCANKEMVATGILVGPALASWTAAMRFAEALVTRQ